MIWAFVTLGLMIWTLLGGFWMLWMFFEGITGHREYTIVDKIIIAPSWLILAGFALAYETFRKKN